MNNVTHWEIPAKDVESIQKFYSQLFDWEFNFMEEMNYWMFQTKNAEGNNAGTGGIMKKENDNQTVTNYVNVKNIDEMISKVEKFGGKIVIPKTPVPTMGWFSHFIDIEGNLMGLWQSDTEANK